MIEQYTLFTYIIFVLDGLLVGFTAGLFAIGGGTAVVPIMTTLVGYSPKIAVGISVMQMVFSSFYNSYLNYKKGTLQIKLAIYPALGGLIGGLSVGLIMKIVSNLVIAYIICFLITWAIIKLYLTPANPTEPEKDSKLLQFFVGLIIGAIATSGGIGGGALLTPALVAICNLNIKKAASMSGLFVAFAGGAAFISMAITNHVDYTAGAIIAISSLPGVWVGNWLFHKISNKTQKKLFIGFLLFVLSLSIIEVLKQHGVINE